MKDNLNILVIGSGGREHALCWALAQSPACGRLFCLPGSDAIQSLATNINIPADHIDAIVEQAIKHSIDLVVVGPEVPLALGLADRLEEANIPTFGPSSKAAKLESSKVFMKECAKRWQIPTAPFAVFEAKEKDKALAYVQEADIPLVIKTDGLAAGKGVVIAQNRQEATEAVTSYFNGRFGEAGKKIVIEGFLTGPEVSLFAISDGKDCGILATAQDYKRAFDHHTGPNTGGMGAFSPAIAISPEDLETAMQTIVRPAINGLAAEGAPYKGILYAGLMLTNEGPKLLEFNIRFGDPECQVLMPRLDLDLASMLYDCARGSLKKHLNEDLALPLIQGFCLTVVYASNGYPGPYTKDTVISGLDAAQQSGVTLFHAGTRSDGENWRAQGGRVLNVTAGGSTLADARAKAYAALKRIDWPGGFYRSDIGT